MYCFWTFIRINLCKEKIFHFYLYYPTVFTVGARYYIRSYNVCRILLTADSLSFIKKGSINEFADNLLYRIQNCSTYRFRVHQVLAERRDRVIRNSNAHVEHRLSCERIALVDAMSTTEYFDFLADVQIENRHMMVRITGSRNPLAIQQFSYRVIPTHFQSINLFFYHPQVDKLYMLLYKSVYRRAQEWINKKQTSSKILTKSFHEKWAYFSVAQFSIIWFDFLSNYFFIIIYFIFYYYFFHSFA